MKFRMLTDKVMIQQGRRQEFFQGGSKGYILDFPGGVGDQIFAHLYGQNKKIAEPGGSADPPDPPDDAPVIQYAWCHINTQSSMVQSCNSMGYL